MKIDEQIDKLISLAGHKHKYQIFLLITMTTLWIHCNFMAVVLPFLEKVPDVEYRKDNETIKGPLTYEICKNYKYNITKVYEYSWVSDYKIECDEVKTGFIGSFTFIGNTSGALLFTLITKLFTHKVNLIFSCIGFMISIALCIIIHNFYVILVLLIFVGTFGNFLCYSSLVLVEESVSPERRSLFGNIVNIGYTFCGIVYVLLFKYILNWKTVFIILIICIFIMMVIILFFIYDSPRQTIHKHEIEKTLEILQGIAKFNGLKKQFDEKILTKEYQDILSLLSTDDDEEIIEEHLPTDTIYDENDTNKLLLLKKKKLQHITAYAFIQYPSIRYKFLILNYCWLTACGIYNGIAVGSKSLPGDIYSNIIILYVAEAFAYFISGILMEIPCLGRKRTIWSGFVITISCCLSLAFINLNETIYFILDLLARFCISANHTIFYTYSLEVYPTPVRSIGFGINAGFGNAGSIISPMFLELLTMDSNFILYAVLCVIAMFLMIFLQETVGKPMKESIDELNEDDSEDNEKNDNRKLTPNDLNENNEKQKLIGENNVKVEEKKEEDNKDEEKTDEEEKKEEEKTDEEEKKEEEKKEEEKKDEEKKDEEEKKEEEKKNN